ncbi:MAG: hypothetical protein GX413_08170 [Acetobacter sp.]|nr:hypothetical protein [Acetobacter sp.]
MTHSSEADGQRVGAAHPLDFYAAIDALSGYAIETGWELCRIYRRGFPQARVTSRLGDSGRETIPESVEADQAEARRLFRVLTDGLPVMPGRMISRIVRAEYPDVHMGVEYLAEGLLIVEKKLRQCGEIIR